MHVLVERRYIFKRKSLTSRLGGLVMVMAVVMATWVSAATAEFEVSGYQRIAEATEPKSKAWVKS
ncbi:MAG: hypothetical protein AAF225_07940 [Pseudomonadota bacterium]